MARRKIKIKRIENATSRQVTFTKRRGGLLKKAHDLSVLCDAEVGVIVFSSKGKLFQFANPSMESVVERYMRSCGHSESPEKLENNHDGTDRVTQFTEKLKTLQSIFIGDNLERLSSRDLIRLEQQIHDSLGRIRAKKEELFLEQLQEIKEKIAATRREVNGNSDVLGKMVEFASSDFAGSEEAVAEGHIRHSCAGAPHLDASMSPQGNSDTFIAQSNHVAEGVPVAKRSRLTEDLNKSPPRCENEPEISADGAFCVTTYTSFDFTS